jgi:cytochrome oxidase Cu insertion factor (SCO1/SenC/PrrC family)
VTSSAGREAEVATAQDADVTAEAPPPVTDDPEATSSRAPAGAASPVDRAAALEKGAPGVPPNFVYWILGAVLVLSLGGLLAEHLLSAVGLNPQAATSTTSTTARARTAVTTVPPAPTPGTSPPVSAPEQSLQAPLAAFMGLSTPRPSPTPSFTLTGVGGNAVSVPARPPSVVVLTFFDATCNDICPVLASEIRDADADLGTRASQVEFVTVNTDPAALAAGDAGPAVVGTGLGSLTNWHMATGPLAAVNAVWKKYGVSISLSRSTGLEGHNDVMDFVDEHGDLRYRATPFANESSTGSFSLPAASEARWGEGIATYARRLTEP